MPLNTDVPSPETNELGYPIHPPKYASYYTLLVPKETLLDRTILVRKKIKLLTWSRNFVPAYLKTLDS